MIKKESRIIDNNNNNNNNISHDKTGTWLRKGNLKREKESLLIAAQNNAIRITKETGGLGSWRTRGNHPNFYIIENGHNTEKSPGDLRRLAVTQTQVKDHQLTLM